ncbi:MAG TPA: alpha/beta hydrolase [Candidatus Dormibacteraeota bacterium]|nr:alpha/beta hydrolase [Candidatus Dormibacteraeota bacterium]
MTGASSFLHRGHRLAYTVHGEGERTCVLLHGLLLSQRMHLHLAAALAERGHRVVTLDLLGHGLSDRPGGMANSSMPLFAGQVVGLLDHLGIERAVIGGTSLGANVTIEVAAQAPSRVEGMLIEMPVLDHALPAGAAVFTPIMLALTLGRPAMTMVSYATRMVPGAFVPFWIDVALDMVRQDPAPSGAVIQGILFDRVAPPGSVRRTLEAPALIIGHHRDPIHLFSDADMLAAELPNARLLEASTLLEMRLAPARLTAEVCAFLAAIPHNGDQGNSR